MHACSGRFEICSPKNAVLSIYSFDFDGSAVGSERVIETDHESEEHFAETVSQKVHACTQRVSSLCSDDADMIGALKLKRANTEAGRQAESEAASRRRQMLANDINLGLPPLEKFYTMVSDSGHLKCALDRDSKQKRAVVSLAKRDILYCDGTVKQVMERLEALLLLDHVNVLALEEVCEDDAFIHLVYEWPEGGLLLDYLTGCRPGVITEAHISSVIMDVLAAVYTANKFNIHHLDLSMTCMFLGRKHKVSPVKVIGFGLAGTLMPVSAMTNASQSKQYIFAAPEILWAAKLSDLSHVTLCQCDVWSVGIILYMLFSGRPPFLGSREEVGKLVDKGHFTFGFEFDAVCREAKDMISLMLVRNAGLRPSLVELMSHPFGHPESGGETKNICQKALTQLAKFARAARWKQVLFRLLADIGIRDSQLSDIEDVFRKLDLDKDGTLDVGELFLVAMKGSDDLDESGIREALGDSKLTLSEYAAAIIHTMQHKDERWLLKAFHQIDRNHDSRITKAELFSALKPYSSSLAPADIASLVNLIDENFDNKVDYKEFRDMFRNIKERNEDIMNSITSFASSVGAQIKSFDVFQQEVHKFIGDLRMAAMPLARYHRSVNLKTVRILLPPIGSALKSVTDVVRDFCGSGLDRIEILGLRQKQAQLASKTILGLRVMQRRAQPDRADLTHLRSDRKSNIGSVRSSRQESRHSLAIQNIQEDETASSPNRYSKIKRSVAASWMSRSFAHCSLSPEETIQETKRRRNLLWSGLGDGIRILGEHLLAGPSEFQAGGGGGKNGVVPWGSDSEWEAVALAMDLAQGPEQEPSCQFYCSRHSLNGGAEQVMRTFRESLVDEWGLDLAGGHTGPTPLKWLMRCKSAKSWLPRLMIWEVELECGQSSAKASDGELASIAHDCITHVLQTCERILFSITDLFVKQEACFKASWHLEEVVESKRPSEPYLPFRGEVDEDARTPRDAVDAEMLAGGRVPRQSTRNSEDAPPRIEYESDSKERMTRSTVQSRAIRADNVDKKFVQHSKEQVRQAFLKRASA